jgi:hypothetical protein
MGSEQKVALITGASQGRCRRRLRTSRCRWENWADCGLRRSSDFTPLWSGQAAALAREMPAKALVLELVREATERFDHLGRGAA